MANSPDINKTQLVVRLDRSLKLQVEKSAKAQNITSTKLVNRILMEELSHVELTADDYRKIAEEIEHEERRRKLRNRPKSKATT
jgi:predicted alternative tryptophan synthase beta-subunit